MAQTSHHDMFDALAVAQKVTLLCHAREIPLPSFEVNPEWGNALEVKWWPTVDKYEVDHAVIEDAFRIEFEPLNGLDNREAETTIDDVAVEFTIFG
jgi:hypothetical protein